MEQEGSVHKCYSGFMYLYLFGGGGGGQRVREHCASCPRRNNMTFVLKPSAKTLKRTASFKNQSATLVTNYIQIKLFNQRSAET